MSLNHYLAFVAASTILLVIPGPTVLAVIGYSLTYGRRAKVALVAAVALGDSTALAFSLLGLGVLLAAFPFWFSVVKWTGGLYLLWLGVKLLRLPGAPAAAAETSPSESRRRMFVTTYLVTALNPKGILFFVAFLPQFVVAGGDATLQLWLLAVTFVVLAAVNASLYAVFAARARRMFASTHAQRYLHMAGGGLLSAAGLWALFSR